MSYEAVKHKPIVAKIYFCGGGLFNPLITKGQSEMCGSNDNWKQKEALANIACKGHFSQALPALNTCYLCSLLFPKFLEADEVFKCHLAVAVTLSPVTILTSGLLCCKQRKHFSFPGG